MKPILLVDVDGVINVLGRRGDRRDDGIELVFRADGFKIRVPFGVRERFARLQEAFDCVWNTTWEADGPRLLAARLGFGGEWPVIHFRMGTTNDPTWKLREVKAWCEEHAVGRRVAWVDDDLGPDAERWAAERPGTLLVRTEEEEGLTQEQTNMLLAWAKGG